MQPIEELIGRGKDQISMAQVPVEKVSFYASEDADIAFQLSQKLKPLITKNNLNKPYYNIELPLIPVLVDMENSGVFVDDAILADLSNEVDKKIADLEKEIFSISTNEFNLNSPQQLAVVLFDELELKQIKKRSTSIEVLETLKFHHPLPELVLKYRHLSKLSSTYIKALPGHINQRTGRVHTSFNQTIASTGRLSSTKPNFQNIPIRTALGKKIRKAIKVQSSDAVILSADYSQIELRIMAHYSKEPELVQAFKDDLDIHARTASLVYSVDEQDVTPEQRRSAKVVNFGIMYGAGPFRMSKELGISMKDAKILVETYFNTYPGIERYIQKTIEEAHLRGYVKTLNGRKRYAQSLGTSNINIQRAEERALINMPIQGTAAELIKIAMINIHNKIKEDGYGSNMILQIHDELIFEVPKYEIEIFSKLVKFEMENAIELSVPLKVDYNWGPSWFDAH
jgi:DNA polymerase-1